MSAGADDGWKALSQANDWTKAADTKAGTVLAAGGVLGGLLVRSLPTSTTWAQQPWRTGILLAGLAFVCASILLSLWVFAPRLRSGEPRSLLYFDHIARRYPRPEEFTANYLALLGKQQRLQEALAEQLWATSRVAHRKYRTVTPAVWLLGAALLTGIAAGLVPA